MREWVNWPRLIEHLEHGTGIQMSTRAWRALENRKPLVIELFKTDHQVKGIKTTFRCNKVKWCGVQCASGIFTRKNRDTGRIQLFRKLADHTCDQSDSKVKSKVADSVKKIIVDQYELGDRPATIKAKLRKMKDTITQPTAQQVTHIINYNKKQLPNPDVSIADMEAFYNEHKKCQMMTMIHSLLISSAPNHERRTTKSFSACFTAQSGCWNMPTNRRICMLMALIRSQFKGFRCLLPRAKHLLDNIDSDDEESNLYLEIKRAKPLTDNQ